MRMAIVPGGAREGAGEDPLEHADALYNLARHLARDAADAEDLVQETYARAFRAMERFSPGTDLRAWLFRILRNAFLDTRRSQRRSPLDLEADPESAAGRSAPEDGALRGDRELDRLRGIVGAEIEAALHQLPEEARMVVLLDLEGLPEGEIAEVMGCAVGTVKSRLSRSRAALRERLADYRR
jgi:RNA polymerase sigma-70 factor (ECF subfamily)